MEKWLEIRKSGDFKAWADALGIDPLCARVIRNRGAENAEDIDRYLNGDLDDLHDPYLLPDMDKAVDTLLKALDDKTKIAIVGDYDVDGVTSTAILVSCIRAAGGDVTFSVPDRLKDGYGINEDIIDRLNSRGVKLIITCDNGIAASEQIKHAYDLGIKVVVTDHHQIPFKEGGSGIKTEILPDAEAVVDPHRSDSLYPFKGICGAMVAFKYMQALQSARPSAGLKQALDQAVQFASLGTVCDVMELADENRYLVREGIKRIEKTQNPGLRALIKANDLTDKKLSAYSLSFIIGPCINSTGRLESASESVDLLLSDNEDECLKTAVRIRELNDSRKNMTQTGLDKALELIEKENMLSRKTLVIYLPELHESIAGLVAGKIKESFNRPTLVITSSEEGLKGSGRSIPAYDMFSKMSEVKDLFTKFGGHAMAAGFSLCEENLEALENRLEEGCGLTDDDLVKTIKFDAVVPPEYATLKLARELERIDPVGTGNPGALFACKDVVIEKISRMGKSAQYGNLTAVCGGKKLKFIYFGDMSAFDSHIDEKYGENIREKVYKGEESISLDICYEISVGEFRGNEYVDYRLKNYR